MPLLWQSALLPALTQHRWRIAGLVIGLAGLLEVLQHVSPTRRGRLPDGLVKAAGAFLGGVLGMGAERILEQLRIGSGPSRGPGVTSQGAEESRSPASL